MARGVEGRHVEEVLALELGEQLETLETGGLLEVGGCGAVGGTGPDKVVDRPDLCIPPVSFLSQPVSKYPESSEAAPRGSLPLRDL